MNQLGSLELEGIIIEMKNSRADMSRKKKELENLKLG
jgi:hypothetical protein